MKRILFVDDDPLVFEGLQRMLAPQNGQWEMSFAPEGETALVLLAATPFDVVVSDLRMPKMDGAALLKTVRERWPGVVRIILSGKADMEDALRAAPVAHQCLLKPCDPAMLRSAIERATSLSELLSSKLLAGIVGSVQDLPVMPRAYIELRDALSNPNYSLKKIVRIVEQDVGISAKILQLVNSAFFGLPKDISSVHNAVCYLGAEMLQNLVLSAEVFHVFEKGKAIKEFSFEDLHMHSQLTAKIAGSLLPPSPTRDAATIAGLLHDVGKLILATRSPQHFARAIAGIAGGENAAVSGGAAAHGSFARRSGGLFAGFVGVAGAGGRGGGAPSRAGENSERVARRSRRRPHRQRAGERASRVSSREGAAAAARHRRGIHRCAGTRGPGRALGRSGEGGGTGLAQPRHRRTIEIKRHSCFKCVLKPPPATECDYSIWRRTYCRIPPCW